jgi:hypothetical protein
MYAWRKQTIELLFQCVMQAFDLRSLPDEEPAAQRGIRHRQRVGLSGHLLGQLSTRQARR